MEERRWRRPPADVAGPCWQRDPILLQHGYVWSLASASHLLQTAHERDGMPLDWMDAWQPGSVQASAAGSWRHCRSQRLCPCFRCWVWGKAVTQLWYRCPRCGPLCVQKEVCLGHLSFGPPSSVSQPGQSEQAGSPFQSRHVLFVNVGWPSA